MAGLAAVTIAAGLGLPGRAAARLLFRAVTSINTLSYADVPAAMLSRATSLTSMMQQLSQSMGVGTGALLLYVMLGIHHTAVPGPRMSPDAGAEVSGRAVAPKPTAP